MYKHADDLPGDGFTVYICVFFLNVLGETRSNLVVVKIERISLDMVTYVRRPSICYTFVGMVTPSELFQGSFESLLVVVIFIQPKRRPSWAIADTTWLVNFYSQYIGVSKNRGTPKSSILIGFSIINHPFWGTPIFGNTHIDLA